MAQTYNSLSNCISSFNASILLLKDSVDTLNDATKDVHRLKDVLATRKVFGLVPEMDLENAKRSVQNEIKPQMKAITVKIENEISRLRRKKTNLVSKVDLQQVRLENAAKRSKESPTELKGLSASRISKGDIDESKLARLMLLQHKKDRLKYSLSRLNLQDKKARLSMIPILPPHNE